MASKRLRLVVLSLTVGGAALATYPAISQGGSSPPARYTVDAGTISGMAAMGAGGGGVGSALSIMSGGGGKAAHELILRLGTSQAPSGEAKGDHFMPKGAQLGTSVPLVTPKLKSSPDVQTPGQMPTGRLLLFWGCGEHAPAGQPVVIDFSKLARGQIPPGLYAQGLNLPDDWKVEVSNSRTYGDWPNERDSKMAPANSSLLGAHKITSSYSPEIDFTLAEDFMPALTPKTSDTGSGAVNLSWNALPKATGYYAWVMAMNPDEGGQPKEMVWWTSSSSQQFGGPMWDWLSPGTVRKLVDAKTVMPPSQTNCTIPAEVKEKGGPMMMASLYGYGPQADFSYPPRPQNAAQGWQPDWIARVRFRSSAMVMHGMPGMANFGASEEGAEGEVAPPAKQLPACKGLAGIAKRAAGLCQ